MVPFGLEVRAEVNGLRVSDGQLVPVARRPHDDGRAVGDVITLPGGVEGRLRGGAAPVAVHALLLVLQADVGRQFEVREPRPAHLPLQAHQAAQGIVLLLGVGVAERIGVRLAVVAAEVALHVEVEVERHGSFLEELARIAQREAVAPVGGVGRREAAHRLCPFVRHVQDASLSAAAQAEALGQRRQLGVRLQGHVHHIGCLAAPRLHLHHAVRKVTILHRRDARDDLHLLDVARGDRARRGTCGLAHLAVVRKALAVHLHRRAEGGIAHLARAFAAQGDALVVDQALVALALASRQQQGDVVDVDDLVVFERSAVHGVGRRLDVLLL